MLHAPGLRRALSKTLGAEGCGEMDVPPVFPGDEDGDDVVVSVHARSYDWVPVGTLWSSV
jgi:hypothetical protein